MTCDEALLFLDTTIGDTLDPAEVGVADAEAMRKHVAACAACLVVQHEIRGASGVATQAFAADRIGDAALVAAVRARLPAGRVHRMRAWRVAAAVLVVGTAAAAWTKLGRAPEAPAVETAEAPPPAGAPGVVANYAGPRFIDVTAASGIADEDHTGDPGGKDWMVETVGHGACALDFDGDGRLDLFVPDGNRLDPQMHVADGWRLYRNLGGMRFADVTKGSGLECDAWAGGAVAGDVNADGRPDLFVPCFGANHLFLNRGEGRFEDVTEKAGVGGLESEWSTAACLGDFDGNGSLDLFVSNYADMREYMNNATGPRGCKWRDMPVACGPRPLEPQQNRLYLNRGDGSFQDVTATNLPRMRRYSFQCVAFDADGDGATDVFVATDTHQNMLLVNDGHGRFKDQALAAGVATDGQGGTHAGMGVALGDVDGDGLSDLLVTNFSHESNTFYRSAARGAAGARFGDATAASGLVENEALLGWGASFLDFDCDGALDAMFANGHLYPGVEKTVGTTSYEQPLSLYRNDGKGRFGEVTASAGAALLASRVHRGLLVADFDDDGRPDAFVTVLNGGAVLLRNDGRGAGSWIQLSLRGKDGLVEAAGAHVVVTADGRSSARDLLLGSSFGSGEDPRLHFGLSGAKSAVVEVRWPYGTTQRFGPLEAGALYELTEARPEPKRVR
jgi:hypothetical protein